MTLFSKIRVAVLRGGPSREYDISLKSGHEVLSLLREMREQYEPIDIFISKNSEWHKGGIVEEPHSALHRVDVVWNALHGAYGEDGQVQKLLESLKIPFTGSSTFASAISIDKSLTKEYYLKHDLLTPRYKVIKGGVYAEDDLINIFRNYLHPVIVKPASGGSSIGMRIAHSFRELKDAVQHAFGYSNKVLVEEFIRGREATCGMVENFRTQRHYAFLPIEIRKPLHKKLFDYEAKYSGESEEISSGCFSIDERNSIEDMTKRAHTALGLRHYSRSDFILSPNGKIYILETNSLPGFTKESLFPKSINSVGWNSRDFVDHVIKLALNYDLDVLWSE